MSYRTLIIVPLLLASCGAAMARPDKHKPKKDDQQVERSTPADPKVALSVCIGSGNIVVRGWDRNEVHARMSDGLRIEFQPSVANGAAPSKELNLVMEGGRREAKNCLPYGSLELDVPRGARVNLQGGDAEIDASGVAHLSINTQNGAVTVAHVSREVDINTLGGEITIRDSQGAIKVHSVGGSIDLRDISPSMAEDVCDIGNVGGDITLAQISHPRVNVNTVGGDVSFRGALARQGRYNFQSISGDLTLTLPPDSSFRLNATLQGEVESDFPLKILSSEGESQGESENNSRKHRKIPHPVEGIYGTGDAVISVSSFMGSVYLRK